MEIIDSNLILFWRAAERFANVLIGGLAIYLGYKLFMNLPNYQEDKNGELKLLLPGDISVYISRVGPGVFFALFGTAIVLMSFYSTVKIQNGPAPIVITAPLPAPPPAVNPTTLTSISYVSGNIEADRFSVDRAGVKRDLVALRNLEDTLNTYVETDHGPQISTNEANTLLNTLQRVKRSLLLSVWEKNWGDAERFAQWVQQGALDPPPKGFENVVGLFKGENKEETP